MYRRYKLFFLAVTLSYILLQPLQPLLADSYSNFYSQNDIQLYEPSDTHQQCGTNNSGGGSSSLEGHTLPATRGPTGQEEEINNQGQVKSHWGTNSGYVAFASLASQVSQPYRDYYINMRWNYAATYWNGNDGGVVNPGEFQWMGSKPRLVLVTDTNTGKSVIADILDFGPAPWVAAIGDATQNGWIPDPRTGTPLQYTGLVSGLSPAAITALNAHPGYDHHGDSLTYSWAPDQSATPGPTNTTANGTANGSPNCNNGGGATKVGNAVFYSQLNPAWADIPMWCGTFGDWRNHTSCGCFETDQAMIASTFTGKQYLPTDQIFHPQRSAMGLGEFDQIFHTHTDLIVDGGTVTPAALKAAAQAIQAGALVIAGGYGPLPPGPFFPTGHYILMRGADFNADGSVKDIWINDPQDLNVNNPSIPPPNGDTSKPWPPQVFYNEGFALYAVHPH